MEQQTPQQIACDKSRCEGINTTSMDALRHRLHFGHTQASSVIQHLLCMVLLSNRSCPPTHICNSIYEGSLLLITQIHL
jgi:hypothetical protein